MGTAGNCPKGEDAASVLRISRAPLLTALSHAVPTPKVTVREESQTKGDGPRGAPSFSRTLRKGWDSTDLSRLGFETRRAPAHQAQRRPHPKNHIKRQAETGPPIRHSQVFNKPVMDEIKNSVTNNGSDCEPKTPFEAKYSKEQESTRHNDFNHERPRRTAHHRKQDIMMRSP